MKYLSQLLTLVMVVLVVASPQIARAAEEGVDCSKIDALIKGTPYYKQCEEEEPADSNCGIGAVTGNGTDYAGRKILTEGQAAAVAKNQAVYQAAAKEANIPWQMLAVVHLRETGLALSNPSNGQGIYQIVSGAGGPYPAGAVNQQEFKRQTKFAAEFIKNKAGSNYEGHKTLTANADVETVKDTFFSYNGRASVYETQAAAVGFDSKTQGYEGSPYVMNKADKKRDPAENPDGWGQIKRDNGGIEYPANSDYGAFVQYAGLTGSGVGGCLTKGGPVRQLVVTLARKELKLWETGELKPGTGYKKYSQNRAENWCADFVSWIYNEAGYPLKQTAKGGNVPSVDEIKKIGEDGVKFSYHDSSGYIPKPGDLVIQKGPDISHVMIVTSVTGNKMTVLGGNQGGDGGGFNASRVSEYDITGFATNNIIGYVAPEAAK